MTTREIAATVRIAPSNPAAATAVAATVIPQPSRVVEGEAQAVRLVVSTEGRQVWIDLNRAPGLELAHAIPEVLGADGRLGNHANLEIAAARDYLINWPIGPQTPYVLIARAIQGAAQGLHGYEALANALDAVLRERGHLTESAEG